MRQSFSWVSEDEQNTIKKNLGIAYNYDRFNNYLFRLAKYNDFAQTIRESELFKQLQMIHGSNISTLTLYLIMQFIRYQQLRY